MDRFLIQTADVGQLSKVKIRHDNSAMISSDWFLSRIEVNDGIKEKFVFLCNQWLSETKGEKLIERCLTKKNDDQKESAVISINSEQNINLDIELIHFKDDQFKVIKFDYSENVSLLF